MTVGGKEFQIPWGLMIACASALIAVGGLIYEVGALRRDLGELSMDIREDLQQIQSTRFTNRDADLLRADIRSMIVEDRALIYHLCVQLDSAMVEDIQCGDFRVRPHR